MKAVQCVKYSAVVAEAVAVNTVSDITNVPKNMVLVETLACGVDFVQTLMIQNKVSFEVHIALSSSLAPSLPP
jgi:hypothetical protein